MNNQLTFFRGFDSLKRISNYIIVSSDGTRQSVSQLEAGPLQEPSWTFFWPQMILGETRRILESGPIQTSYRSAEGRADSIRSVSSQTLIWKKVLTMSFWKSHTLHKSVNLLFIIANVKDKLINLYGNWLLQNDFLKTKCETRSVPQETPSPSVASEQSSARSLPQPKTLNPEPYHLKSQLSTLNPQPSTLNPQPYTLNPQPYALNPTP